MGAGRGGWLLALLLAASCRLGPDRPAPMDGGAAHEEPPPVTGAAARRILFAGLADAERPLAYLAARASGPGEVPRLARLAVLEGAVRLRYARGTPLGPLRQVIAFGCAGHAPLEAGRMADLLLDPEVERRALDATSFRLLDRRDLGGGIVRSRYRVEMLGKGAGPFRFDFRFAAVAERWDLADGSVLVRHEPAPDPQGEGVTLYRGLVLARPAPGGSHVVELLVLGTDTALPFFLVGVAHREVLRVFGERVRRIWAEAARRAAPR